MTQEALGFVVEEHLEPAYRTPRGARPAPSRGREVQGVVAYARAEGLGRFDTRWAERDGG
jgi:hypothetical protein